MTMPRPPYTKVSCSRQGVQDVAASLLAGAVSSERGAQAWALQWEGWRKCPRAGERERCASLFYKCTNAP